MAAGALDPMVAAFVSRMQDPAQAYDVAAIAALFPRAHGGGSMQRYQCHKIVEAAKIVRIESHVGGDETLYFGPPTRPIRVGVTYVEKHRPEAGGYYVRYDDRYESWSPSKAFEAGYDPIVDDRVSVVVRRHPGHALHLSFTADEPYERVRQQIERALGNFLRHAFFGTAADGSPNPVVPAEEELTDGRQV